MNVNHNILHECSYVKQIDLLLYLTLLITHPEKEKEKHVLIFYLVKNSFKMCFQKVILLIQLVVDNNSFKRDFISMVAVDL